MKIVFKFSFMILFIIMILNFVIDVSATSGSIRQNSVIECNGQYYGSHGNPLHWHLVEKKDGKWVSASSNEVEEPSCYADLDNEKVKVTLSKCVDGDTAKFIVDGEVKTTRFLAIDTPESVHPTKEVEKFGKEASDYTCKLLTNAKEIVLEFDKNSNKEDKYGRLLAFVYTDSKMVQETLIEKGYAKVAYLYADYTHTETLKQKEKIAKNKKIGIWSNENITSVMDLEETNDGDNVQKEIENNKNKNTQHDVWDKIWQIIEKLMSNLFEYLESVL